MVKIYTTHVGSFPLDYTIDNVLKVFKDMIEIGIDYPPFPQLRSFIDMYLRPLIQLGIIHEERGMYYISDVSKLNSEIVKEVRIEIPEAFKVIEFVKDNRIQVMGLRAPVTGPFTLAFQVLTKKGGTQLRDSLASRIDVIKEFFVPYIGKVVEFLSAIGYDFIVIDEPVLSIIVGAKRLLYDYKPDDVIDVLEKIFNYSKAKLNGIHVCGRIPTLLKSIILQVRNIKILDHEFKSNPENFNVYTFEDLEKYDKFIAVGVLSSRSITIESFDEVKSIVNKAIQLFKDRLMFIKPDCGFRELRGLIDPLKGYEIALEKLKIIVKICKEI